MPRPAGFKNEYWDGHAHYTPRPPSQPCYLPLREWSEPGGGHAPVGNGARYEVRPLLETDWPGVARAWQGAMQQEVPLSQWHPRMHRRAADTVIDHVRRGGDGEVRMDASYVAVEHLEPQKERKACEPRVIGATLVTAGQRGWTWGLPENVVESPPPFLDWIFIELFRRRIGLGTALLTSTVRALQAQDVPHLASSAMLSSPASTVFHWRHGFRVAGMAEFRTKFRKMASAEDAST
jgi:hypothetical protein